MLEVSNFIALHVQHIFSTYKYNTTDTKHFYEVANQWCIVS